MTRESTPTLDRAQTHAPRARRIGWLALLAALGALAGCDSKPPSGGSSPTTRASDLIPPPATPPQHGMAPGLREQYPDVASFLDQFLATCLVGDYNKYRTYVSRRRTPESRERFTAIYYAIESVMVESIDRVDHEIRDLPAPAYLVISEVHTRKDAPRVRGPLNRRVAIVVFKEGAEWRMVPAPTEFQPEVERGRSPTTSAASQEAPLPDYPWEAAGDG